MKGCRPGQPLQGLSLSAAHLVCGVWQSGSKRSSSAMHVLLLLLICGVPGGGTSTTSASLESSSDSKSPGRALAKAGPSSCRDVWGDTKCAKKISQCASKKKVRKNCEATCEICTPSSKTHGRRKSARSRRRRSRRSFATRGKSRKTVN
eukprot:scaffold14413_cov60-Phaeocystis_antarctica.AAC.2